MNLKRSLTAFLIVFSIIGIYSFSADDDIITKVTQQLEKWTENHPIEKVHLHLDKPYYTAGDDIWFKAYVTIGSLHELSTYSGILNVELINDQDSVKQSLKLELKNGTAFGDFALPDTLHEGNYRIRAYTQYMLNAGSDYVFDKAISIGNAITNKVFAKASFSYADNNALNTVINYSDVNGKAYPGTAVDYAILLDNAILAKGKGVTDSAGNLRLILPANNPAFLRSGRIITKLNIAADHIVTKNIPIRALATRADVQFFPEGGNMVNGIPAKVAFKAIGTDGLGIDIKGTAVNAAGADIAQLTTSHLGMGIFSFTPKAGEEYYANVVFPDGSKRTIALPKAGNEGYVLQLAESGADSLRITVAAAKSTAGQSNLIAQSGGKVYYSAKGNPGGGAFSAVVAKSKFPTGIAQFTLFSSTGNPLNERLVFIQNPRNRLDIAITADKKTYQPRQKVMLIVESKDGEGQPSSGNLSVAVTDETRVPVNDNTDNHIMASLLLTADLKGYVEQPAYYFNKDNDKTRVGLDVLMLTQGYRRFEWKNVMDSKQTPVQYPREAAFTIAGKVTTTNGKPVVNGAVQLISYENGLVKIDTVTDQNGRFAFTNLVYADSMRFLINGRNAAKNKDVVVTMDNTFVPAASPYKNQPDFNINMAGSVNTYAENSKALYYEQQKFSGIKNVRMLKEVQIKAKPNAPFLKHSSNIVSPAFVDQVLSDKDIGQGCRYFADCIQGRLIGVGFAGLTPYSTRTGKPMEVILDGVKVVAVEVLMKELNSNDVQAIEVIRGGIGAAQYGSKAGNGVIIITTKRGDGPVTITNDGRNGKGVIRYQPKGAYTAREFYSPKYDAQTNQKLADLRTTVFWKPDLITDESGNASIEYFNAGSPGTYRVVVEGIDGSGNIGRQVLRYKVE